jgi:hypothetical protein
MPNRTTSLTLIATVALLAGCQDADNPAGAPSPAVATRAAGAPAPSPLVTASAGGAAFSFWGYTSTNFSGDRSDPINLIFAGDAGPLSIREALLRLGGARAAYGLPAAYPFDCTWSDAIGEEQTGYSEAAGWAGSVVQLQCGRYEDPVRFHLRLFAAGGRTIANAHVDLLIPGTTSHQVLSWEVAEQLVTVDMVRSGLLGAAPSATGQIHEAPFRSIPPVIYNGLPAALKQLVVDPSGSVAAPATASAPVPILTDGRATILTLKEALAPAEGVYRQEFTIQFQQVIPKPFCNTGAEYVYVQGPIDFVQEVQVNSSGRFSRRWTAAGEPTAMPLDPSTGQPLGSPQPATVRDGGRGQFAGAAASLAYKSDQQIERGDGTVERLEVDFQVGPYAVSRANRRESCGG